MIKANFIMGESPEQIFQIARINAFIEGQKVEAVFNNISVVVDQNSDVSELVKEYKQKQNANNMRAMSIFDVGILGAPKHLVLTSQKEY